MKNYFIQGLILFNFINVNIVASQTQSWTDDQKQLYKQDLFQRSADKGLFDHIPVWEWSEEKLDGLLLAANYYHDMSFEDYKGLADEELNSKILEFFEEYHDSFVRQFGKNFVVLDSIYRDPAAVRRHENREYELKGFWRSVHKGFPDILILDSTIWISPSEYHDEIIATSISSSWKLENDSLVLYGPRLRSPISYELVYIDSVSIILNRTGRGFNIYANRVLKNPEEVSESYLIGRWHNERKSNILIMDSDGYFEIKRVSDGSLEMSGDWTLSTAKLTLRGKYSQFELPIFTAWENDLFIISKRRRVPIIECWKRSN